MNTNLIGVALRLKKAREYLHLSQELVASQMGLTRTAITAIEAGKRNITAEELDLFSRMYGLTMDEIMHGKREEDSMDDVQLFARSYSELSERDKREIQNLIRFKLEYQANHS